MTWLQRFITASGTGNLADGVAVAARGWIASPLTRDALPVALVPVALRLPRALPALPALVPSDRLERAKGQLWSAELLTSALIGPALVLPFSGGQDRVHFCHTAGLERDPAWIWRDFTLKPVNSH